MAILWYVGLYLGSMYVCVRWQSAKLNNENLEFLNSTSVGSHFNVAKHAYLWKSLQTYNQFSYFWTRRLKNVYTHVYLISARNDFPL